MKAVCLPRIPEVTHVAELPELATVAERVASGRITVALACTFALTDATAARELSESGHPGGKILIDPS